MRGILTASVCAAGLLMATAVAAAEGNAVSGGTVKIGVLNDRSGAYSDLAGRGSEVAARIAVEEFGGTVLGRPVEVVAADMQLKADVAASIARTWFDTADVDVIVDNQMTSAALAVQDLAKQRGKITISSSSASARLTGKDCSPTGFKWSYDTYSAAAGTAEAIVKRGGKDWFFITADYAFGHALEEETARVVKDAKGRVRGSSRHPIGGSDFASQLLTAQASGAKVIGLANSGSDTINVIKQGHEFGLGDTDGVRFAGLGIFITDVKALGLAAAKNMLLTTSFYWDLNEKTRAFSDKFYKVMGRVPTQAQAGVYSGVHHYLTAVKAAGTDDGVTVAAKMKALPVDDLTVQNARILPNGRVLHDMYLARVKAPSESKGEWDLYEILATLPGRDVFQTFEQSGCVF